MLDFPQKEDLLLQIERENGRSGESRKVCISPLTEERIRALMPFRLTDADFDYTADWLLVAGIAHIETCLRNDPKQSLGSIFQRSFSSSGAS